MVEVHDVVIIGGGLSGLGAALQLSAHKIQACVFEAETLCSQTSGNSHRVVHGGFRYLQSLALKRVYESAYAQAEFFSLYQRYLTPFPCLLPLSKWGATSALPLRCALTGYEAIQKMIPFRPPGRGRLYSAEELLDEVACFSPQAPHGAFSWVDARVSDLPGLVEALATDIRAGGSSIQEHAEVIAVSAGDQGYRVQYIVEGEERECEARVLVNTTGPWINHEIAGLPDVFPGIFWCKGYNLLLRKKYEDTFGLAWKGSHGAYYFMVPRGEVSAIGTQYTAAEALAFPPILSEDDIGSFVQDINNTYPELALSFHDVQGYEVGYLPAKTIRADGTPVLFGAGKLHVDGRYIALLSTKFTTCFTEGEKIARQVVSLLGRR